MPDNTLRLKAKKINLSTILYLIKKTLFLKITNVKIMISRIFKLIIKLPAIKLIGKTAIKKQGKFIETSDGKFETPLVNGKECAYAVFTNQGVAQCGIENAHKDGKLDWKKPISCHLYPIRVQEYSEFTAINYHHWQICETACSLGAQLKVPVYKFVKDALIRKFGEPWYNELDRVAQKHLSE